MALTVGELTATITVDDSEGASGLRQFEGRLRDATGRYVRTAEQAGRDSGQALGDGLDTEAGSGAGRAGESIKGALNGLALGAIGTVLGGALMAGMTEALDQGRIKSRLAAQLGATAPEAKKYGDIAGQLYADAITEDFQGAADTISAVMRAGILPPDATNAQIKSIAANVSDLASTFELDLGQTANAVGQMIKTGLAKDGTEAVDALTAGLQKMGPRADDIADTFNEYSTIFRQMGISATDATGLLSQGMKAGARDTDVVADALKEFTLIAQGGGDKVDEAFAKIGLSGKDMQKAFIEGGPSAKKALDQVFDGLRNMGDGADRNSVALALFGTKTEDTQKALMALDPSSASEALGDVGGAADRMGDTLRDNASTKITQFQRALQQNLVDFLGGKVLPALEGVRSYVTDQFSSMWAEAGKGGATGVDQFTAAFGILGQKIVEKVKELGPKVIEGIVSAGQAVADFVTANPESVLKIGAIAAAMIVAIASLPLLVGAALISAATLMMWSFGARLVSALLENVPRWWNAFTGWVSEKASQAGAVFTGLGAAIGAWFGRLWSTYISGPVSRTWSSFISGARALPGRAVAALSALGTSLSTTSGAAWQRFRTAATQKVTAFITYVRGMPARIAAALGGMGSLLTGKGRDLVRGLVTGVRSMGGWLRSQLMSFARDMIPGPIAKALGIASPSRVMADQIGRWIPAGIVDGIDSGAGAVDSTMRNLVSVPTTGQATAATVAAQTGTAVGGAVASGGGRLVLDVTGADAEWKRLMRKIVRVDGRGSVQTAFS